MPVNSINSSSKQNIAPLGPVYNQTNLPGELRAAQKNPVAKGPVVEVQPPPKKVRIMSEYGANVTKGFVSLFSLKTFKSISAKTLLLGAGIAGGVAIGALAGPPLAAALTGLAASAVFPPVAIAIGATLGAALLVFGIYKLVQMGKTKLKDDAAARETLAQAQSAQMPVEIEDPWQSEKLESKPATLKSVATKSVTSAKPAAAGKAVPPMPEMNNEEQQAWAAGKN